MDFINKIKNYSLRCSNVTISFPMQFIANICLFYAHSPKSIEQFKIIHEYLHNYFMKHYKPYEIPKLFAILSTRYLFIDDGDSPYVSALEYMDLYEKQVNGKKLTKLSIFFDKEYPEEALFKGSICNTLSGYYYERHHFKKCIPFNNEACNIFINENNMYSVYSSIDGLDFAMDFVQMLVKNDYNITKQYRFRYKKLIKYLINSYFALSAEIYCEQQGRMLVLFGRYYTRCCTRNGTMNGMKAKEYAMRAVHHLNEYILESKFLMDAYGVLYIAEKCLFNIKAAKKMLHIQYKLLVANKQKNERKIMKSEHQNHLKSLNQLDRKINSKSMKLKHAKLFYSAYWRDIKQDSLKNIGIRVLNEWIEYITNDGYYQVLKNICCLKECNYQKCKRKDVALYKCSKCVSVYYCGRMHQKMDWNKSHRNECKVLTQRDYNLTLSLR